MNTAVELPLYQCHKQVRAAKITGIEPQNPETLTSGLLLGDIQGRVEVNSEWLLKHHPRIGSYYVVYDDGYTSCSPAEPFESGYTPVPGNYQDRVRIEHEVLVIKITKLETYLNSNPDGGILFDQLGAMRLYRNILAERIAAFMA